MWFIICVEAGWHKKVLADPFSKEQIPKTITEIILIYCNAKLLPYIHPDNITLDSRQLAKFNQKANPKDCRNLMKDAKICQHAYNALGGSFSI